MDPKVLESSYITVIENGNDKNHKWGKVKTPKAVK